MKAIIKYLLLNIALVQTVNAIEIAITVDDLPDVGAQTSTTSQEKIKVAKTMLSVFKKHKIHGIYGFINGGKVVDNADKDILNLWVTSGQLLGNHTYSHINLANHTESEYITDIKRNEILLSQAMHDKDYKYFRYPFLSEGNTKQKRDSIRNYLSANNYKIAEVTLDFWDYEWNDPYSRCVQQKNSKTIEYLKNSYLSASVSAISAARDLSAFLFNRDIKYIMLLHIGALDAIMLDQVLTRYEKLGAKFISLPEALTDEVYSINSEIIRDTGYTLLNEIRLSRKLDNPDSVTKFYNSIPEDRLSQICR